MGILKSLLTSNISSTLNKMVKTIGSKAISGVAGLVRKYGSGIMGKGLRVTNNSPLWKVGKVLGKGMIKVVAGVSKPILHVGKTILKNTPKSANHMARLSKGTWNTFFKKAEKDSKKSLLGYRGKWFTAPLLWGGALAYGIGSGAINERYNLGLTTAINGMTATEGAVLTPGTVNESYTPVYNHGATGEIPLALHNKRNSGYL